MSQWPPRGNVPGFGAASLENYNPAIAVVRANPWEFPANTVALPQKLTPVDRNTNTMGIVSRSLSVSIFLDSCRSWYSGYEAVPSCQIHRGSVVIVGMEDVGGRIQSHVEDGTCSTTAPTGSPFASEETKPTTQITIHQRAPNSHKIEFGNKNTRLS